MGLFDEAIEVIFDGEEVISIVSGNDSIWEKQSQSPNPSPSLILSSNKNSFSNNDVATLTVEYSDSNGVNNKSVSFYKVSSNYSDTCVNNNISNYTLNRMGITGTESATVTYENNAYVFSLSSSGDGTRSMSLKLPIQNYGDFTFSCEISASSLSDTCRAGITGSNNNNSFGLMLSNFGGRRIYSYSSNYESNYSSSSSLWNFNVFYKLEVTQNESEIISRVYDSDNNLLYEFTNSFDGFMTELDISLSCPTVSAQTSVCNVKNITVNGDCLGNLIDTVQTTNNNGQCSVQCSLTGSEDITVKATCGYTQSNSINIEYTGN